MCPKLVWGGVKLTSGDFIFSGWNTEPDGSGVQYDERDALDAIGRDSGVSDLTLYANWKTNVTFDANGGKLSGGTTTEEKILSGKSSGSVQYSVNQTMATGLKGSRSGYTFITWNTKSDGSGTDIENYGTVLKPATFYAIYYQSSYSYTGSVKAFTAPVDGWYKIECWGAGGGSTPMGSAAGGYASGEIHLPAGTVLYVVVGGSGSGGIQHPYSSAGAGYNGGGAPESNWAGGGGGRKGGGGATDVRTSSAGTGSGDWRVGLDSRIIVAGGAGGSSIYSKGGIGGSKSGNGGFGYGGTAGGSGWYGGSNGGGGSSYVSDSFRNARMVAGANSNGTGFDQPYGKAQIVLIEKD